MADRFNSLYIHVKAQPHNPHDVLLHNHAATRLPGWQWCRPVEWASGAVHLGWLRMGTRFSRCSRMYGGLVMPTLSITCSGSTCHHCYDQHSSLKQGPFMISITAELSPIAPVLRGPSTIADIYSPSAQHGPSCIVHGGSGNAALMGDHGVVCTATIAQSSLTMSVSMSLP